MLRGESNMNLDFNYMLVYLAAVLFILIVGKIFIVPIKVLLKLILNSLLGGLLIFIINLIGAYFHFHIGLNILTSIFVGLLGIPGAIVIVIIKLILG